MKKRTLLLTSAIALGTLIAPLASCSNRGGEHTVISSVDVQITGVEANLVTVNYDEKLLNPGSMLTFEVKPADETIIIKEVKFNGMKLLGENNSYQGYVITGVNTIAVVAEKKAAELSTLKVVVKGTDESNVKVDIIKGEVAPGEKFTVQLTPVKDVRIDQVVLNNFPPCELNPQHVYELFALKGENILKIKCTYTGQLQPTIGKDTVLYLGNGEQIELKKDSNLNRYISEPVEIKETTLFGVYHKEGESYKNYGYIYHLNEFKTFAGVSISTGHSGVYKDLALSIAGGAKYKFVLDLDLDKPLYVERTEVTELPTFKEDLQNLLNNNSGTTTNYRHDIAKVEVTAQTQNPATKGVYKEISTYERYSDTQSLNKIETLVGQQTKSSIVYHEIKDNVLYTVDTFADNYGVDSNYTDISYRKNVVTSNKEENKKNVTKEDAYHYVASPVRNQGAIGNLINSYNLTLGTKDAAKITSTATSTGFTSNINSRKIYKPNSASSNEVARLSHGTLNFLKDGSLLSASYKTYEFDGSKYDFANDKLKPGVNFEDGLLIDDTTATITYGLDKLPSKPAEVDTYLSKYFISSITNVTMKDNTIKLEGNNLYPDVALDFESPASNVTMKIDYLPATALDVADYGVISSENNSIVGTIDGYRGFFTKHLTDGETRQTTNVTIGNYVAGNISKVVSVTVIDEIPIRSLWFANPSDPRYNYDYLDKNLMITSKSAILMLGQKYSIQIAGTSRANLKGLNVSAEGNVLDLVSTSLQNQIVSRTYGENNTLFLNIDLSLINTDQHNGFTTPKSLDVTFNGPLFDGANEGNGKFHFDIYPKVTKEDLYGKWESVLVSDNGPTYTSTLTLSETEIKIDIPQAIEVFNIKYPIKCQYKVGKNAEGGRDYWNMKYQTYAIDADVELVGSEFDEKHLALDFTTFYYHPVHKKLAVVLTYLQSSGADSITADNLIGTYEGGAELLSKIA